MWFAAGEKQVDRYISDNFKCYFEELANKKFDGWIDDKEGRLAMIIICD